MNSPRTGLFRNALAGTAILLMVAACGGGGGGGSKGGSGGTGGPGGTQPTNPGGGTTTAPDTTITSQPSALSNSSSATFDATSSVAGGSFEASVDSGAFSAVTLPLTLTGLSDGNHTISIRALDSTGTADASPATYSWTIDTSSPSAAIVFPPRVSYTDASAVIVRGTGADANGITAITVNGVAASSNDGYNTWSVEVPIATGQNELVVAATDSLGNTSASAASASVTNRGPVIAQNGGMIYDEPTKRLIVADRSAGAIYAFDENGVGTLLAGRDYKDTIPLSYHGIVLDAMNNRAVLLTSVTVSALDLSSGTVQALTACSNDTSIGMSKAEDLAIDPDHARAFLVTSEDVGTVASIDLGSPSTLGTCTTLASGTVGSGESVQNSSSIEYDGVTDPAHPRLLVGSLNNGDIIAIDLATQVRTKLPVQNGSNHLSTADMRLDSIQKRLLVLDPVKGALVSVDLQDGTRAVQAAISRPSGQLAIGNAGVVFAGDDIGSVLRSDTNGTLQSFIHSEVGTGTHMTVSYGIAIEQQSGTPASLLVTDLLSLSRIDLATGNRQVVSSATVGNGDYTGRIANFAMDTRAGHEGHAIGIMRGADYSLVSVDLTTGNREKICDLNLPSATHLVNEVRIDALHNRAIIVDIDVTGSGNDALHAVDLASGNRTTISGKSVGSGTAFNFPSSLILEPAANPTRAIIANGNNHNLLSVDLATGVRSVFSNNTAAQYLPGPLTLDSKNSRILGSDDYGFNLFSASLSSGEPQAISGFDPSAPKLYGRGPALLGASGVAVDADADIAYVTQRSASSVLAIDLQTRDRVLISR